ncbi:Tf2-6, partial [Mucuna pruriens]
MVVAVFYWKHMRRDIEKFVQDCEVCQQNKYQAMKLVALLQPLRILVQVWEEVSMNFLGGLPISIGKDTIMVVVDRLTKSAQLISLHHPYSTKDVAKAFIYEVVFYQWVSQTVDEMVDMGKILVQLPSYNASISMSPFHALYGREPPTVIKYQQEGTVVQELKEVLEVRKRMSKESQMLIKLDNLPDHENTWEDFPQFHLEEKSKAGEGEENNSRDRSGPSGNKTKDYRGYGKSGVTTLRNKHIHGNPNWTGPSVYVTSESPY